MISLDGWCWMEDDDDTEYSLLVLASEPVSRAVISNSNFSAIRSLLLLLFCCVLQCNHKKLVLNYIDGSSSWMDPKMESTYELLYYSSHVIVSVVIAQIRTSRCCCCCCMSLSSFVFPSNRTKGDHQQRRQWPGRWYGGEERAFQFRFKIWWRFQLASYLMFSFVWWSSPAQRIISFSNQGKIYGLIEMCGEEKGPVLFRVSEADADRRNGLSWGFCERRKISSSVSNPQMKIILRSTFLSWLIEIVIFVFGRLLGLYHFNYLIPDDVCLLAAGDQWWWGLYN